LRVANQGRLGRDLSGREAGLVEMQMLESDH
jgi:hypothetical protein